MSWFTAAEEPLTMTDPADAIEQAMESIDALHAKRMHLLKKSSDLLKEAKEYKSKGDTTRAMACMKRRQQIDTLARQVEGQLLNLEKTSMMMDSTATTVELAHTMKQGSETIKSLLKDVSVDDIEQVADDLNENMTDAHDLAEALARPMGGAMDEEDILAEMEEWDRDPRIDDLPNVPVNTNNGNAKEKPATAVAE